MHGRTQSAIITAAFIVVFAVGGLFLITGLSTIGSNPSQTIVISEEERPSNTSDPSAVRTASPPRGDKAPPAFSNVSPGNSEQQARQRALEQELQTEQRKSSLQHEIAARDVALKRQRDSTKNAEEDASCREKLRSKGVYLSDSDPCIDLDDLIKKLASGVYHFNKPATAFVEEPFRVVLALATAEGQDVSSAFLGTAGKIVDRPAPFAQHLEATLRGGLDFKVEPHDAQPRTITSSYPVVWEWNVTPMRPGKKTIVIDVSANLVVGKQKELVQLRTLYEEIQINVGFLHWFVSTFSGLWGTALGLATMIIAVLGVVHYLPPRRQKVRHHKRSDEPPPIELVTHQQSHSDSPPAE